MTKRILIVDDALIMRKRIGEIALRAGWEVAGEAINGEDAIAVYERERPDLVTLDIVMPKVDGVTALKRLLVLDPDARIIMISAVDQRQKLAECISSGAMDFIVKPFDGERLQALFSRYLERLTGDLPQ
ncbi:MAG: two-component system chemotaxis response regulator CheY [Planctomycetota bacterium]|jgi:two-component system chemotaxis response regulator CheY